ncbi:MAG TPA: 3-phosphoserine/phosphohydroxythreonine transaminase [Thauera sp.]|uniref:3-phosphoserine/phosphohydroxythreonine transaminase n=1 Tax=Thauera sp. TaxID=1905334 RepID=UPI002B75C597|nr:3-phosphoserine/phosphohydroxythreonine transaminase [Thauera sp.]HRP23048.1 3-phosphoserine/phosphohydroxythreonine transaminase [Thauera sp.]HRP64465.1 3-phosphoserine/phosphohydroxythreonine transaminase [Thauera sp.]
MPEAFAAWRAQAGFSFSAAAGPLPREVAHEVAAACRPGPGSILSLPFTSSAYRSLQAETEACLRRLLAIPDDFAVLFMAGGASVQFALVPMHLLGGGDEAGAPDPQRGPVTAGARRGLRQALYIDSGHWSRRAIAEAQRLGRVRVLGVEALAREPQHGLSVPPPARADGDAGFAYVHVTPNETADGLQFPALPRSAAPLVADLTSELLTRPLDWRALGLVYAGTQKTIGTPGLTLVVVRRTLLGRARADTPRVMDYAAQAAADSRLCTPPVLAVFVAHRMLHWIEAAGGVAAMAARLEARHALLAAAMASGEATGLYRPLAPAGWRSRVNPCFQLADAPLCARFLAEAEAAGLRDLGGHAERGGVRLSVYNGLPDAAVEALAAFLDAFARRRPQGGARRPASAAMPS